MTSMTDQTLLAIENFELNFIPGSVKKFMSGIKAVYEGTAEGEVAEQFKIKGAGGSSDLWKVPVNEIKILDGFNVRLPGPDLDAHIDFLADSIYEEGFFQHRPLAAVILEIDGKLGIYAFDGHCRLLGTKKAITMGSSVQLLPVVVQDGRNVNLTDLLVQMRRLNKGKDHSPLELGILCKRLANDGLDDKVIGKRMGIKPQYVDGLVRLVNSPKPLFDAVRTNELSASDAIQMLRSFGPAGVVQELESRRARAHAKVQASGVDESSGANGTVKTNPPKIRLTARFASNANVKKVVRKHGMELFETTRALKSDPAYENLSVMTRLKLDALLAQLAEAEKADALPSPAQQDGAEVNVEAA
jgi:hypothetical protein